MNSIKYLTTMLAAILVSACNPKIEGKPVPTLQSYQASEFEPTWQLKLTDGNLIEFTQLDPGTGADMVTDSYEVRDQNELLNGWFVTGEGAKGMLGFRTLDVSATGGCTHSGSGITHRDEVTATSPLNKWRGCGGPEL